ncbi:YceI family protein [Denitrificimonas caeni]|uniref:YceI family protein n=1 Tax=Denitrificimonas caeni TaxID=521720 RepID=UPI00196435F1|nr:YceI family protein [Denitrificimonas caeni]
MKKISLVMLMLLGLSPCVFADWELLNDESSLHYVSIKNSKAGEINSFKTLAGSVSDNGTVSLTIDLTSLETNIPIRNERMQDMLFQVGEFAEAHISGMVDLARVSKLEVGETYRDSITLKLSLHGAAKDVTSGVQITKLAHDKMLVSSLEPVLVNAEDYGLAEGIEALRVVASLPIISTVVPVTYSLVFEQ